MAAATVPEMCRAPLEEVVLHAILLGIATPAAFLARAPSAPPAAAVAAALDGLSQLQACDSAADGGSTLTPLGVHLAAREQIALQRAGRRLAVALRGTAARSVAGTKALESATSRASTIERNMMYE